MLSDYNVDSFIQSSKKRQLELEKMLSEHKNQNKIRERKKLSVMYEKSQENKKQIEKRWKDDMMKEHIKAYALKVRIEREEADK